MTINTTKEFVMDCDQDLVKAGLWSSHLHVSGEIAGVSYFQASSSNIQVLEDKNMLQSLSNA